MKFLILTLVLLSSSELWSAPVAPMEYVCDEQKELTPKVAAKKVAHDSEEYKKVYTGLYFDLENSVRRICEYLKRCEFNSDKEDDKEIRSNYLATSTGKKTLSELERIRKQFGYTTIDAYLFDDHELNELGNVKTTHLVKKGDRTFYLDDLAVVGILDQVGEEAVLTRYTPKCEVAELVSFTSLTHFENPVHMKVTKKYCSNSQNKGPTFKNTDEILREMGAYMQNPGVVEEQMEAEELCGPWLPKTEPLGMVIDTAAPAAKAAVKGKKSKRGAKTGTAALKTKTTTSKLAGAKLKPSAKKPVPAKKKKKISSN